MLKSIVWVILAALLAVIIDHPRYGFVGLRAENHSVGDLSTVCYGKWSQRTRSRLTKRHCRTHLLANKGGSLRVPPACPSSLLLSTTTGREPLLPDRLEQASCDPRRQLRCGRGHLRRPLHAGVRIQAGCAASSMASVMAAASRAWARAASQLTAATKQSGNARLRLDGVVLLAEHTPVVI